MSEDDEDDDDNDDERERERLRFAMQQLIRLRSPRGPQLL